MFSQQLQLRVLLTFTLGLVVPAAAMGQTQPGDVSSEVLDEIIVLASKRSVDIQDVTASVTALTAADIENRRLQGLADFNFVAPNTYIEEGLGSNSTASIYIRGLGQINPSYFFDAPVAIYSDGVYYARNAGALADFADVERVEILRGPQGTIFGRNASAGAIQIISQRPPVDAKDFFAELGFGNDGQVNGRFNFGTPLIDGKSGLRIAAATAENDGYQVNTTFGDRAFLEDVTTAALTYLHKFSENSSLRIRGELLRDRGLNPGAVDFINDADDDPFTFESNFGPGQTYQGFDDIDTDALSATFEIDFGSFDLISISAYREVYQENAADGDGSAASGIFENQGQVLDQRQFTQELYFRGDQIGSTDISWIAGAFYLNEFNHATFALQILPFFPQFNYDYDQDSDSIAAYTQFTFPISDSVEFSAGLRYTDEEKQLDGVLMDGTFSDVFEESRTDWSAALKWAATDNINVYFSSGTSFRSGGFNGNAFFLADVTDGAFATEEVLNFEAGVKSLLMDDRLRLNASVFLSEYQNMQVAVIDTGGVITNTNADVDVSGVEVELTALATDNLELFAHVGTISNDINVAGTFQADELPRAPDIQGQLGFNYTKPVGSSGGEFRIGASYRYTDDYYVGRDEETKVESYGMVDANISYSFNRNWRFIVEGKNLTDEIYNLHAFFVPGLVNVKTVSHPRRWLASVRYTF